MARLEGPVPYGGDRYALHQDGRLAAVVTDHAVAVKVRDAWNSVHDPTPFAAGEVVAHVWTDYALVDDGQGGKFMEPQRRQPVQFRDLLPAVQARLAGLAEAAGCRVHARLGPSKAPLLRVEGLARDDVEHLAALCRGAAHASEAEHNPVLAERSARLAERLAAVLQEKPA